MATERHISVTVVCSNQARQWEEHTLNLQQGSTVQQALHASGFAQPTDLEGAPQAAGLGIWGKKVALSHVLQDQDRLEVYRPLLVDPKVARRERFAGQGAKKAAGLFAKRRAGAKAGY